MPHSAPRSPDRTGSLAGRETYVATRLGRLHVRVVGEGPTTVLWPSMFVDSHTWDPVVPLLPGGRRYVLIDPPGLGLSDGLRVRSDIVGAADAAVDLLAGMDLDGPVDWVGNAFGGHVGFELGARSGVLRSLVAVSSPAEALPAGLRRQISLLLPVLRTLGPVAPVRSAILAAMLTDASAAEESIRRVVVDSLARPSRRSLVLAVQSYILDRRDITDELADLAVPCLFVASDDRGDWSPEHAARAADRAPDAEVVTIAGARTLVPLEQPGAFAAQVRRFWDQLD